MVLGLYSANNSRIWSNTPVYVAGFERIDLPTGDWSITIASEYLLKNSLWISELLPEPATPVTQTNMLDGILTSIFFKLLAVAFLI